MALIRAKEWAEKNFAVGSQPTALTISRWIKNGAVNGKIIAGTVYVDESNPFPECETDVKQPQGGMDIPASTQRLIDKGILTIEDYRNRLKTVHFNGKPI